MPVGIYGIKHTVTGRWYIGQSVDITTRRRDHLRYLRLGMHHSKALQCDYNRHGLGSIEFHVLQLTTNDALDTMEAAWIARYGSTDPSLGYNIEGGGSARKLQPQSVKDKISKSLCGHHVSEETRRRIGAAGVGRKASAKTRALLSRIRTGRVMTDDIRKKISAAAKGRDMSAAIRAGVSKRTGVPLSEKHKESIGYALTGRKASETARLNMKIAQSARRKREKETQ